MKNAPHFLLFVNELFQIQMLLPKCSVHYLNNA